MKKKIILLPLIMMALASCGGNNPSNSAEPAPSNSTSEKPSESASTKPSESTSTKPSESTSSKPSESASTSTVTPVGTTSIADVLKAGFDETAGTTEFTFEGTVVGLIGDNSYYLQQGDAGIYVYKTAATGNAIGKKVKVVSKITNYNGLIETDYATSATVTGDGEAITAVTYTTKTFKKENQCTLANIKGLKYESGSISLGNSAMLTFKEGTENVLVRVDKNLDDSIETAIKEKLESLGGNDTVDFVNTILYMNSKNGVNTVTVGLTSAEQMVINRGEKVPVTGVTADASIELTVGKTAKITASVEPAGASEKGLTFKSNDETKATVDAQGVVTGVAEGNTTITVASKDDATKVATVNVTVKTSDPSKFEAVNFTINDAIPDGMTYVNSVNSNPDYYGNGALKIRFTDVGVSAAISEFTGSLNVAIDITLNPNSKKDAGGDHVFTVTALNAAGEECGTAYFDEVIAGTNSVKINVTSAVTIKVILTAYPKTNTTFNNVGLKSVALAQAE